MLTIGLLLLLSALAGWSPAVRIAQLASSDGVLSDVFIHRVHRSQLAIGFSLAVAALCVPIFRHGSTCSSPGLWERIPDRRFLLFVLLLGASLSGLIQWRMRVP